MVSGQKTKEEGLGSAIGTYKFKVSKSELIIRDVDLKNRTPEDIIFKAAGTLDPVLKNTQSASEEAMLAVVTKKATINNAKIALDDQGRHILSCDVVQKKDKNDVARLSLISYKDGSVDVVPTSKEGEVEELLSIKRGGKISVYDAQSKV